MSHPLVVLLVFCGCIHTCTTGAGILDLSRLDYDLVLVVYNLAAHFQLSAHLVNTSHECKGYIEY